MVSAKYKHPAVLRIQKIPVLRGEFRNVNLPTTKKSEAPKPAIEVSSFIPEAAHKSMCTKQDRT